MTPREKEVPGAPPPGTANTSNQQEADSSKHTLNGAGATTSGGNANSNGQRQNISHEESYGEKLSIPDIPPDASNLDAALLYAKAGFYVLPARRGSKHPGSIVGTKWQDQSSRNPKMIAAWFAGTDHDIALHCGRSGGIAFDVDDPGEVPELLRPLFADSVPYQSTRPDTPGRGHYMFRMPPGRDLGNSTGALPAGWGEVRGKNGVIMAEPSWNANGKYHWDRVGIVPELPQELAEQLPKPSKTKTSSGNGSGPDPETDAATDAEVAKFMLDHSGGSSGLIGALVRNLNKQIEKGKSRHEATASVMAWAMGEAAAGLYPASSAAIALKEVFIASLAHPKVDDKRVVEGDLADSEWSGIRAWAVARAQSKTEEELEAIRKKATMVNGLRAAQMDDFWTARTTLGHIRLAARARGVNPLGMLGVALVRASCMIPPNIVFPPVIGGPVALNLFTALVGPSGGGKGGSESAERNTIRWVDPVSDEIISIPTLPVGTGEGVARTFQPAEDPDVTTKAAIFTAAEVQVLEALFDRGGTLEGVLRSLSMGEELGFTNAQRVTRTLVPRLSYRAGLVVGVQPLCAGPLLRGAAGGTPQRFIWMPVIDPDIADTPPDAPTPLRINRPRFSSSYHELELPQIVRDEIWAAHVAMHRGETDPLNVHSNLTRLKVAAALMVLDGRTEPSVDDWELAGHVMTISTHTREAVRQEAARKSKQDNLAKAHAQADRDDIISVRDRARIAKRIVKAVVNKINSDGATSRNGLLKACTSAIRGEFGSVFNILVAEKVIVCQKEIDGRHADSYDLGPEHEEALVRALKAVAE